MVLKSTLSFILDSPIGETSTPYYEQPPAITAPPLETKLPSLFTKKRHFDAVYSPSLETKFHNSSTCSPLQKKQALEKSRHIKSVVENKNERTGMKTPIDKRKYNRERQQNLRRQETQERESLRQQVQALELQYQELVQNQSTGCRIRRRLPQYLNASNSELSQLFTQRTSEYTQFTDNIAHWVAQLLQNVEGDYQWLQNLQVSKGSTSNIKNTHSTTSKPLPSIELDLSDLPPGSRKRMYNRLRQRIYRQRELHEVENLNQEVHDLTVELEALKANQKDLSRNRKISESNSDPKHHEGALQLNDTLKAKLRQHMQLSKELNTWVEHVEIQLQHDYQFLSST